MEIETNDWGDLPFFLALSRSGSLRSAAEMLRATHATVNRRITQLEQFYGVQLFERSVEGLALTPAGEELLPLAINAEEAILRGRRKLSGLDQKPSGNVRVSIPPGLAEGVLAPILAEFLKTYPDIDLEVIVTNTFQDLNRHEIDVSVRVARSVNDDVVGRKVLQYAAGIFASRDYVESIVPNAGPNGEGLTWVGWGDKSNPPEWVRKSPFPKASVRNAVREGTMQIALANAGAGMTILPLFFATQFPDLIQMPGTRPYLDRSIWVLLHSDLQRTKRVRLLVDHLAGALKNQKAAFLGELMQTVEPWESIGA